MFILISVKVISNADDKEGASEEEIDVELKNYYNFNYVGCVHVGNPP